jgi:shikimate dehydrogenase
MVSPTASTLPDRTSEPPRVGFSAATRIHFIIGDPISQAKAPEIVTARMRARNLDAIVIPIQIAPENLDEFMRGAVLIRNLDGMIVTVPHKFAAARHCARLSERAAFLDAVNVLRRHDDGTWLGDHVDGLGFVLALQRIGIAVSGCRAFVVGAGGAGSAIVFELLQAGASRVSVTDLSVERRDRLVARLAMQFGERIGADIGDLRDYSIVANATSCGMLAQDPLPLEPGRLQATTTVFDIVPYPDETPLLAAAKKLGCPTLNGAAMVAAQADLLIDFMTDAP